ncbi:MAG: hypothetical protein B6D64_01765 [Bacteroidetes bacterium 4484_276]|nr:MAG: hypothetical protein B6D64_01765 [Bacteroidetes bacterium 4484_276]
MDSKTTLGKIIINNGLITALILFVLGIIYYVLGIDFFSYLFMGINFVLSFGIVIVFMILGMKAYRDNVLEGKINYGKKLLVGVLISLIALILSGVLSWIFFELVDPDYVAGQMEDFMMNMEDMGLPEEQLDEMREKMEKSITPLGQLLQNLKTMPVVAIVISLIVAAFVKNDTTIDNQAF